VRACPTGARHFGDIGDPGSPVSKLVAERGGYDLMPETGYKPVNKYLPPRERKSAAPQPLEPLVGNGSLADRFFRWADRVLSG
jgi:Fe-S-cluster-containing dehydrogenase component